MAQIFITGSTGLIGRAVVAHLQSQGHSINTWVRNTTRATSLLGEGVRILGPDLGPEDLVSEMENADAVINLAGRSLASSRWTKTTKETFISSRVGLTRLLANSMKQCANPPKVFISSSAVGYYGDRGSEPLNEASGIGEGFLSTLCADWEAAALETAQIGTRVCLLRTGIVLGREGGILKQIMQGFDLGIGLYTGTDDQVMSWIHLTDMARVINYCLENPSMSGPVNCASPSATTAKSFARTLATITHSRILIKIPSLVLRIVLGDGAKALSQSQNVVPAKLKASGFEFQYDDLETALRTECRPDQVVISKPRDIHKQPNGKAQFELTSSISVKSNQDSTFAFFSSPHNLGLLTPSWMNFRISEIPGRITEDSEIAYRLKIGLLPIKWRSKIVRWNPNEDFIDSQVKGPYRLWWHEHRITPGSDGGSVMSDTVRYSLPGGIIGKVIHNLFIKRTLIRIFSYRRQVIELRFGSQHHN